MMGRKTSVVLYSICKMIFFLYLKFAKMTKSKKMGGGGGDKRKQNTDLACVKL